MHQILHIFRKDLRHFYPEATVCILVTAAFARVYPAQWVDSQGVRLVLAGITLPAASLETLATIFTCILPLTWLVLIVRLIQDECLVGERPYWFTRPFDWPKLLAAKLLFLTIFLVLPLAVAQAFLLHIAGFPTAGHLLGLAYLLLLNCGAFVLPLLCLAVITRNFLRASLTLLGTFVALIVTIGPLSDHLDSVYIPAADRISFPLVVLVGSAVVVSQYASRKTWLARSLLVMVIVTITVLGLLPLQRPALEQVYYTAPQSSIPVDIRFADGSSADKRPAATPDDNEKRELLSLPLAIADVPYGFWVVPDDAKLALTASDGTQFISNWHSVYNHVFRLGTREAAFAFKIPKSFLERARRQPVSLRLSLALTQWEAGTTTHYAMPPSGPLTLPGFGICASAESSEHPNAALRCRFPLHQPTRSWLTADVTQHPCPTPPGTALDTFPENATTGEESPDPADFGLSSVWDATLSLAYQNKTDSDTAANAHLCPGANVSLTPYHPVRRAQYTLTANNVIIPTLRTRFTIWLLSPSNPPATSSMHRTTWHR